VEPLVLSEGSGYTLEWASNGVTMEVSRIKPTRLEADSVKAQVAVYHKGSSIIRSNPTLTSVDGVDKFWRKLNRRRKGEDYKIDWEGMVEVMAGIIIDRHRALTNAVDVEDIKEDETLEWRVHNILLENINLIYGDGGSGKSMTGCLMAVLCASGYMGSEHGLVVEPGRVLYIDWETTDSQIKKRIRHIRNGLKLNPERDRISYLKGMRPFLDDYDHIVDEIARTQSDLVILDSMGMAMGGDLEKADDVNSFFRGLNKLEKPVLLISHTNKSGQLFGSQYVTNNSRMIWEMVRSEGADNDDVDMVMFHRKGNDVPQQQPIAWRIEFNDEDINFIRTDILDTTLTGRLSIHDLTYRLILRDGAMEREILWKRVAALKTGKTTQTTIDSVRGAVNTAITRYKKKNMLQVNGPIIGLPADDFTAEEVENSTEPGEAGLWQTRI